MTLAPSPGTPVLVVLTLATGHRCARAETVRSTHRRHLVLSDGTSWPLPSPGTPDRVYDATTATIHLELAP